MRASPDPRLAVGLIGLGNMGTAIAERLLDAGYPLVVHNRTPEKADALEARGAVVAATPGELVQQVDVVITSLANDEAFEDVTSRVIAAARPGIVLVDTSTVSPGASERTASLAEMASVRYLRAPVSGNPSVVRAGNLSFIQLTSPALAGGSCHRRCEGRRDRPPAGRVDIYDRRRPLLD